MLRRRAIPVLLAAATLVPIGALGWLGARILQQDRDVERQRRREGLEVAAGRLALEIDGRLSDIEEQLVHGPAIRLTADGPEAPHGSTLLYRPGEISPDKVPAAAFANAEELEFQRQDLTGAAAAYRRLSESPQLTTSAAALNRLGRVLRKTGDARGALEAYARLVQLGSLPVEGQPAALLARQARCRVFEETANTGALRKEARDLAAALYSGGWRIDRSTFELYRDMLQRWGAPPPPSEAVARTEAAIALWRAWRSGDLPPRGRRILRAPRMPVLALWSGGPEHPVAWLATPAELEAALSPLWTALHLAVSLFDIEGQPVLGRHSGNNGAGAVALNPAETRLPFILSAVALESVTDDGYRMRQRLLISGLLLTCAFMIAAAFGLYRVTARELELIRQQSDFVSAVSHEFRTPLTSMRHLTELLVSNSVPSESRKSQYYQLLSRETERLHRMVEGLLGFGRIEAGAYAWCLESVDPRELVPRVVEEFRQEPHASGRELFCEIEEGLPPIQADREALSRALWNLLENAGKYSEPSSSIRVFARRSDGSLLLGVQDQGAGITPAEQARIFQKFVRGAEAKRAGIRGVGVGLALVKRIVEAHGGSVRLKSEPGRGSTFILVLPCHGS